MHPSYVNELRETNTAWIHSCLVAVIKEREGYLDSGGSAHHCGEVMMGRGVSGHIAPPHQETER